jgi:hypothetical protein
VAVSKDGPQYRFVIPGTRNPTPRRGGSRVLRTGPERGEPEPLSDPRQITARTMYRTPPKTSSAPSPMTIILASRFIAATNAPTMTRRNTATEPRFKREDGYSFQLPPRPLAVSVGSHQRNLLRQRIFGDRVIGANLRAEHARKRATEAAREADADRMPAVVGTDGRLRRHLRSRG